MFEWASQVMDAVQHLFSVGHVIHIGDFSIVPSNGDYLIYYLNETTQQLQMVADVDTVQEAIHKVNEIKINFR
jgi:hypothetical protein